MSDIFDLPKIAIVFSIVTPFIVLAYQRLWERNRTAFSNLEFMDKLFNERNLKKQKNIFLIEQSFSQMYRKTFEYSDIKILLRAKNPTLAFDTYVNYSNLLKRNKKESKFEFIGEKHPYWFTRFGSVNTLVLKSFLAYFLIAIAAYFITELLAVNYSYFLAANINAMIAYLFIVVVCIFLWLLAIGFLLLASKSFGAKKAIEKGMGDVFVHHRRYEKIRE